MPPLLTICCLCYNHASLLRQCLDGFVMQKTSFPFVVIIHDDASTDGSTDIIREYEARYPDIIKPIYEVENQYQKFDGSISRAFETAIDPECKYIALCEGDDCWTDPNKLQLQVDFLEAHPDYFMSSHCYTTQNLATGECRLSNNFDDGACEQFQGIALRTFTHKDYFKYWFTQTLTIVHRNSTYLDKGVVGQYPFPLYDYISRYYLSKQGKCAYFLKDMATYHQHDGGVYTHRDNDRWRKMCLGNYYALYQIENEPNVLLTLNRTCAKHIWRHLGKGQVGQACKIALHHASIVPASSIFRYLWLKLRSVITRQPLR